MSSIHVLMFVLFQFIFSIICSTVPVPSGSFIPVFKIGAAFGRLVGELMHMWFPTGLKELRKAIEDTNSGNLPSHSEENNNNSNGMVSGNDAKENGESDRDSNSVTITSDSKV
ncbi:hypothetical protein NQ317_008777 [Molorchus minor]|uniref:Uncharacterized protein n=1 Tax=Molorchus minor TaxID=1323400 RepID=A0ABQ9K0H7_9CUCU|nr:hypothetical protein NQ317_008777 [Molorchus minor]